MTPPGRLALSAAKVSRNVRSARSASCPASAGVATRMKGGADTTARGTWASVGAAGAATRGEPGEADAEQQRRGRLRHSGRWRLQLPYTWRIPAVAVLL